MGKYTKENGAITLKWEMENMFGKMEILIKADSFQIKGKAKEHIIGVREINWKVGGETTK